MSILKTCRLDEVFDVKKGATFIMGKTLSGNTPLVTSSATSNGISKFIKEDKNNYFKGNCLTVALF